MSEHDAAAPQPLNEREGAASQPLNERDGAASRPPNECDGAASRPAGEHGAASSAPPAERDGTASQPATGHGNAAQPAAERGDAAQPAAEHGDAAQTAAEHGDAVPVADHGDTASRRRRALVRPAVALAALLVVGLAPVGRAWFEGRAELLETDRALRAGDRRAALGHARNAAGWWLPGSPFAEGAFARMRHIGHTAEVGGDVPGAIGAWRALLASAARVRWPTAQLEADVAHARAALARLEADDGQREAAGEPAAAPSRAPGGGARGGATPTGARGSAGLSAKATVPLAKVAGGEAGAALVAFGGLVLFALGAAACLRRGAAAFGARWPVALAGAGLLLSALGFGSG